MHLLISMETKYAWAAGYLDGEGCITILRRSSGIHFLSVIVNSKRRESLEHLQEILGGQIYPWKLQGVQYYRWAIGNRAAGEALAKVLPHLTIKQEECRVALRFQSRRASRKLADKEADKLDYLLLQELKK
jgi:LAGLIDADG DNA endonuclease family protein